MFRRTVLAAILAHTMGTVAAGPPPDLSYTTTNFSPDSQSTTYVNQEVGFYGWGGDFYLNNFNSGSLNGLRGNGLSMAIGLIDLSAYVNTATIPQSYFDALDAKMALVLAAGVKVVTRPVYNYTGSNGAEASLSIMLGHIAQVGAWLTKWKHVIAYCQAGFVGNFGEWWGTSVAGNDNSKLQVRNAMMQYYPNTHHICFRYPEDQMKWVGSTPLTQAEFDAGLTTPTSKSRQGFMNDCFLAGVNDSGTYDNQTFTSSQKRTFAAGQGDFSPFGGETCQDAGTPLRTSDNDITTEGALYNLSYLNSMYASTFLNAWTSSGIRASTLNRRIGPRLCYDYLVMPVACAPGQAFNVTLRVTNYGWSRIHQNRNATLRLTNGTNSYDFPIGNVRRVPANGGNFTFVTSVSLPASAPVGTYTATLYMPDQFGNSTTSTNANYMFRNANVNSGGQVWNASSGTFSTGVSITVSGQATGGNSGSNPGGNTGGSTAPVINAASTTITQYQALQSWNSAEGALYNGSGGVTTNGARQRIADAVNSVSNGRIVGVFLSLGYNDGFQASTGTRYPSDMPAFVARLKQDFDLSNARIGASRPNAFENQGSVIRSTLAGMQGSDPQFFWIDTDNEPRSNAGTDPYDVHFQVAGYMSIGSKFYDGITSQIAACVAAGKTPIILWLGDSNANGQADDNTSTPAGFTQSARLKIRTYTGTWATYQPATWPNSGIINYGTNGSPSMANEVGLFKRFRTDYPNVDLYNYKEGQGGSYVTRGVPATTFTGSIAGSALTVQSGTPQTNYLLVGDNIPTGAYYTGSKVFILGNPTEPVATGGSNPGTGTPASTMAVNKLTLPTFMTWTPGGANIGMRTLRTTGGSKLTDTGGSKVPSWTTIQDAQGTPAALEAGGAAYPGNITYASGQTFNAGYSGSWARSGHGVRYVVDLDATKYWLYVPATCYGGSLQITVKLGDGSVTQQVVRADPADNGSTTHQLFEIVLSLGAATTCIIDIQQKAPASPVEDGGYNSSFYGCLVRNAALT